MKGFASIRIGALGAMLATAGVVGALLLTGASSSVATSGVEESKPLFRLQVEALERYGLTTAQARREVEVQMAVKETHLPGKLQAAMGSAFGGVWFEPAAAKLHVGVTSAASRAAAEAVAAEAGLSADVVATPVQSTARQLRAAGKALGRRFSGLLSGGKITIALQPDSNEVEVQMASTVPPPVRAELRHEARSSSGAVALVPSRSSSFGMAPEARCRAFEYLKGFCDPTIAGGVSATGGGSCTTGPALIQHQPTKTTTETYLLTAGHCITKIGETWTSSNKSEVSKEIGNAIVKLTGKAGGADAGVVKVENPEWINATQTPVDPAIPIWQGVESDPEPVIGSAVPVKNQTSCHSGSSTGSQCGVISKVELEGSDGVKELVEVQNMTKVSEPGDSGGPWFSTVKGGVLVEGVHTGRVIIEDEETDFALFERFGWDLGALSGKGYEYDLLTTANQTRPKCPMPGMKCFEAESYPATITGSQTGTQTFGFESGSIQCGTASFSATLAEGSETLEVPPSYSSCLFGVTSVTADVNECKYKFAPTSEVEADKYKGTVDVVCPSGKSIALTSACGCTITIGSQTALGTVEYVNTTAASPKKDVDVKLSITGLKYTEGSVCKNAGTRSNGTYSGELTLKADAAGGSAQGVWVSG